MNKRQRHFVNVCYKTGIGCSLRLDIVRICTGRGRTQGRRRFANVIDRITSIVVVRRLGLQFVVLGISIGDGMVRGVGIRSLLIVCIEAEGGGVLLRRWLTTAVFRRRCVHRWNDVRKKIVRWTFAGHLVVLVISIVFLVDVRWGWRKVNDRFNMNSTGAIGKAIGKGSGHFFIGNGRAARRSFGSQSRVQIERRGLLLGDLEEHGRLFTLPSIRFLLLAMAVFDLV